MWFIGVEVEQETSAPPPKKNPGSAPEPDVKTCSPWKEGFISFPPTTFLGGPGSEFLQIWVCHCMAGNSPASMYMSVISVVCRTSLIHKFGLNQLFSLINRRENSVFLTYGEKTGKYK